MKFTPFSTLMEFFGKVSTYFQKDEPKPEVRAPSVKPTQATERLAAVKTESELQPPKDPAVSQATSDPVEQVPNETGVLQPTITPSDVAKTKKVDIPE